MATVAEGESVSQVIKGKKGNEDNSADSENLSDTTDGVSKEKDEGKTSSGEEKEGKLSRRQAILLATLVAKRKATHPWKM